MPFTPDAPFPKTAGQSIRSKDWNDLVVETQRLDTAKVNRTGDAMTGPLTIAAALGVGTATPAARLHVLDSASPTVLRVQSSASFGSARVELWSDPQGSGSEWRPGYIQSVDQGGFTGGLSFVTNGAGAAQRTGSVEAMRLVNGRVGIGVPIPGFKLDVSERIRLREGGGSAGLWLFQTTPNADRAFVGMHGDDMVGLWGQPGTIWGLTMNVSTGNVGIRATPTAGDALRVAGNISATGRVRDARVPSEITATNQVNVTSITNATAWVDVPGMSMGIVAPAGGATFLLRFSMNGVQGSGAAHVHAEFRLLVDGAPRDFTLNEFHNNGWELRGIFLQRILALTEGAHTVKAQWSVRSPDARGPLNIGLGGTLPEVRVTLTGCFYGDTRSISAIEL